MTPFAESAHQLVRTLTQRQIGILIHADRPLEWRHHGLGMLQAEFSENLRIHIWHPELVSPHMAWPRCVHDHRFDIASAVVIGEVIDIPCHVREVLEGDPMWTLPPGAQWCNIFEIEHAKNQDRMVSKRGCSTATSAKMLARADVEECGYEVHRAGEQYNLARRTFHTTRIKSLAITVIHRSNFDERLARVLCAPDKDVTAVSGIVRDTSHEHTALLERVIDEAWRAIENL